MKTWKHLLLIAILLMVLAACGGSDEPETIELPTVEATKFLPLRMANTMLPLSMLDPIMMVVGHKPTM